MRPAFDDLRPVAKNIFRQKLHVLYELKDAKFRRRELWLHDPEGYLVILIEGPRQQPD